MCLQGIHKVLHCESPVHNKDVIRLNMLHNPTLLKNLFIWDISFKYVWDKIATTIWGDCYQTFKSIGMLIWISFTLLGKVSRGLHSEFSTINATSDIPHSFENSW